MRGTVKAPPSVDVTSLCAVTPKIPTFLYLINDTQYRSLIKNPLGWFILTVADHEEN